MDYDAFFPWKALLWSSKCREIALGMLPAPVTAYVYPTNACNLQCRFCIMEGEKKGFPTSLPKDTYVRLVQEMDEAGVKCLHIAGGGEPLLHPWTVPAVKKFSRLKVLSTNGTLLTPAIAEVFDRIRISFNGGDAATYERVMGEDMFDDVVTRVHECVKSRRDGQTIGLGFVMDSGNWTSLGSFCELAASLDVDFVHVRPAWFPRGSEDERKLMKILPTAMQFVHSFKGTSRVKIFAVSDKFEGYWTPRAFSKCTASPLQAVITASAEFVVCPDVFIRWGDLNVQSFMEAWQSHDHRQALAKVELDKCPRCVMNKANEVMEHCIMNDDVMGGMLGIALPLMALAGIFA